MINHKLLCLLEGKCWHEWEGGWSFPGEQHDYKCKKCGLIIPLVMLQDLHLPIPVSPDYSSPNTYIPFLQWFWWEKKEMWSAFLEWVYIRELKPALNNTWKTSVFIVWLFSATGNTTLSINTWYHIAVSVNANAISLYVNGTRETITGTSTLTNRTSSTNSICLGQTQSSVYYYRGYVSNVSILSGVAKYSGATITVPTEPLPTFARSGIFICKSRRC